MQMVQCHFARCRLRKPIVRALHYDGRYYCDMACLVRERESSESKEVKPAYMSQPLFELRRRHFSDEDHP